MEIVLHEALLLFKDFYDIQDYLQSKLHDRSVCLSVEMLDAIRRHPMTPINVPVVGNERYISRLQKIPWFKYGVDRPVIFKPLENRWPFMRVPVAVGVISDPNDISEAINTMNNDLTSRPIIVLMDGIPKPTTLELCYPNSNQIVSWPLNREELHGMAAWLMSSYAVMN